MRYPSLVFVKAEQKRLIEEHGGIHGIRDEGPLESAHQQPLQSFGGQELYPGLIDKAAALGYFLISNHPFLDGNKRIGHEMLEWVLLANGMEIEASVDEQEQTVLRVASGRMTLRELTAWLSGKSVYFD